MRRLITAVILALMLAMMLVGPAIADEPGDTAFQVSVTGQLKSTSSTDDLNFNGAAISITYAADLLDNATDYIGGFVNTYNVFDVFTMNARITGRPNGAPDITGLTTATKMAAINYVPVPIQDELYFFPGTFNTADIASINIGGILINLGSEYFFEGQGYDNAWVTDLLFFEDLLGTSLTAYSSPIIEGPTPGQQYIIENMEVTADAAPPTIDALIDSVTALSLDKGFENSLVKKLENALKSFEKGNNGAAVNQLNAFINEVEAQSGKKISAEDAQSLIEQAQTIIAAAP